MQNNNNNIIASLDIGASKIVCIIGYINNQNKLYIKGMAHQESQGIKYGDIVDVKLAANSIINTIAIAERMAGFNINSVALGINGNLIKSNITNLEIGLEDVKIDKRDIHKLAKEMQKVLKENKKELIHLIPLQYYVNGSKVENPVDIIANKLQTTFHSLFAEEIKINNIKQCIKKTPLSISHFVFESYAAALACLNDAEKEKGSLLIDIGADTTSFSVIHQNKFIYGDSVSMGGNLMTSDIAKVLNIKFTLAEKIKILNVNLLLDKSEEREIINVNIDEDEEAYNIATENKKLINDIFKARFKEILNFIIEKVYKNKVSGKIHNIVLTGGVANVLGIEIFVNDIFDMNTRIGNPDFSLLTSNIEFKKLRNPSYASSVGILSFLKKVKEQKNFEDYQNVKNNKLKRFIDFFTELFIL